MLRFRGDRGGVETRARRGVGAGTTRGASTWRRDVCLQRIAVLRLEDIMYPCPSEELALLSRHLLHLSGRHVDAA